jgi:hypothetical protein
MGKDQKVISKTQIDDIKIFTLGVEVEIMNLYELLENVPTFFKRLK